jgi:hypothetical protein
MKFRHAVLFILLAFFGMIMSDCMAQKQLVVLKSEDVKLRLYPGDEIIVRLKGSKNVRRSYVNNLLDYAVVLHKDTVPLTSIERIYFRQHSLLNTIGTLCVFGGAAFLIIDQVNNSLIQGNEFSIDSQFTKTTLIVMAVGLPLMLFKKKYAKIGHKNRLMVVSKGSGFWRPDSRKNAD